MGSGDQTPAGLGARDFFKDVILTEFGGVLGVSAGLLYFFDRDNVVQAWTSRHSVLVAACLFIGLWFRFVIWDSKRVLEKQRFMARRPKVTIGSNSGRKKKS